MPGAPNRPPEKAPEAPVAPPVPETPQQKALRRLAPARVALLLDIWKANPSPELTGPYQKAEAAYAQGNFADATSALDLLSIRFTEPRWPSLPEPFRRLRVSIPAPTPPHWDPENALSPAEREAHRARRAADDQLHLAEGTLTWAGSRGIPVDDLAAPLARAKERFAQEGASAAFFEGIDAIWTAVRARFPSPTAPGGGARPAPSPDPDPA